MTTELITIAWGIVLFCFDIQTIITYNFPTN